MEVAAATKDDELLAMNEALEKFALEDAKKAEVVKLRYFGGLTFEETAKVLGISELTAKRWWTYARARLYKAITAEKRLGTRLKP